MITKEIPEANWRRTLDELSRRYGSALVSIEVIGIEIGAQEEVHAQPLRGISSDTTGITVHIARQGGIHLEHRVTHPSALWIEETDDGAVAAIEIEGDDGLKTLLRFHAPIEPKRLDAPVESM